MEQKTRKINFTVEIDDNGYVEEQLIKVLGELLGSSITDYQVLPDTSWLYDNDTTFRKLAGLKKKAKQEYNDYLNSKL